MQSVRKRSPLPAWIVVTMMAVTMIAVSVPSMAQPTACQLLGPALRYNLTAATTFKLRPGIVRFPGETDQLGVDIDAMGCVTAARLIGFDWIGDLVAIASAGTAVALKDTKQFGSNGIDALITGGGRVVASPDDYVGSVDTRGTHPEVAACRDAIAAAATASDGLAALPPTRRLGNVVVGAGEKVELDPADGEVIEIETLSVGGRETLVNGCGNVDFADFFVAAAEGVVINVTKTLRISGCAGLESDNATTIINVPGPGASVQIGRQADVAIPILAPARDIRIRGSRSEDTVVESPIWARSITMSGSTFYAPSEFDEFAASCSTTTTTSESTTTTIASTTTSTSTTTTIPACAFVLTWGSANPQAVATDGSGNVYVADGNNEIAKYDSNGGLIGAWDGAQSVGPFGLPIGVAADGVGDVFVADGTNNRIWKFDSTGSFITAWGSQGSGDGQFSFPFGVATDSGGNVYVSDAGNDRIQKFDANGGFITAWGSPGTADGQFDVPEGLATDTSGNVYVADVHNYRVQKFDLAGAFLTAWGSAGTGDGQFDLPHGPATDAMGNVYVADYANNRVEKFDGSGTFLLIWGTGGNGNGEFIRPISLAVGPSGSVYVADNGNNRIQKFACPQ